MEGTTHCSSTPTPTAEAALIPNKGLTVHRMSLPSKILLLLWVYSVKQQQLTRERSVSSVEIVL